MQTSCNFCILGKTPCQIKVDECGHWYAKINTIGFISDKKKAKRRWNTGFRNVIFVFLNTVCVTLTITHTHELIFPMYRFFFHKIVFQWEETPMLMLNANTRTETCNLTWNTLLETLLLSPTKFLYVHLSSLQYFPRVTDHRIFFWPGRSIFQRSNNNIFSSIPRPPLETATILQCQLTDWPNGCLQSSLMTELSKPFRF